MDFLLLFLVGAWDAVRHAPAAESSRVLASRGCTAQRFLSAIIALLFQLLAVA
jgi:hypothetical protein